MGSHRCSFNGYRTRADVFLSHNSLGCSTDPVSLYCFVSLPNGAWYSKALTVILFIFLTLCQSLHEPEKMTLSNHLITLNVCINPSASWKIYSDGLDSLQWSNILKRTMANQKSPSSSFPFAETILSSIPSRATRIWAKKVKAGGGVCLQKWLEDWFGFQHVPGIRKIINHSYVFHVYLFPNESRNTDLIMILH